MDPPPDEAQVPAGDVPNVAVVEPQTEAISTHVALQHPSLLIAIVQVGSVLTPVERTQLNLCYRRAREEVKADLQLTFHPGRCRRPKCLVVRQHEGVALSRSVDEALERFRPDEEAVGSSLEGHLVADTIRVVKARLTEETEDDATVVRRRRLTSSVAVRMDDDR